MRTPHGYARINKKHPKAWAFCDASGFLVNHEDLVPKMEWQGNKLIDTGFLVMKRFLLEPNEFFRTPNIIPDPVPIRNPRLGFPVPDDKIMYAGDPELDSEFGN